MSENNKKEQNDAIDMTQIINSCWFAFNSIYLKYTYSRARDISPMY